MKTIVCLLVVGSLGMSVSAQGDRRMPPGYWPLAKSQPLMEKTQTIRLAPDLSHLTAGERRAVELLLQVGQLVQTIYENQRHPQAVSALRALQALDRRLGGAAETRNLLDLYRLNQGPITTTLENKREPFLPVDGPSAGANFYPWGIKREEIDAYLTAHPDQRDSLMHLRTVVRRATAENLRRDLGKLRQYPVLDVLHPGLRANWEQRVLHLDAKALYAAPYSVAYADEITQSFKLLNQAADAVNADDEEFARYLRNRARDLLSDDYESGDAAWVTGRFKHLNLCIGSYETYDDALYGVKTSFAFSLLAVRPDETAALRAAMKGMQALENSLPYDAHKRIKEDIPVGVYDVIADFAQARGGNTATILPNESYLARRYGRTILLRANIMRNPDLSASSGGNYQTAVVESQKDDLTADGNFYRTLWHEVGHYLGVDRTRDDRDLDEALQDDSSLLEEMKADLVSLYVAEALNKQKYYTDEQLRSVYAGGILRVLQNNKPRRDQPYQTMQLMQWNFFLENGLLSFDQSSKRMTIHYNKYHEVIGKLLAKVLAVQYAGDKANADKFIDQYTKWDDNLHGEIAKNIRAQQKWRFRLFKYAALNE